MSLFDALMSLGPVLFGATHPQEIANTRRR
jgi:hypothetical protein